MPLASTDWTVARVHALPDDGQRYEIIAGELFVNPAPRLLHQKAVDCLWERIAPYVRAYRLGLALTSPADIIFDDHTLVQPDVLVSALFEGREPREWSEIRLLLAAEVVSPSTQRLDRTLKRRLYQRERVPDYWIIDLDARLVIRWRPDDARGEELDERIEWRPEPTRPPLVIELSEYFEGVLGA